MQYLMRIAMYEDQLHAAITVNPNALEEAEARDPQRAGQDPRAAAWPTDRTQGQHPNSVDQIYGTALRVGRGGSDA